ncbi:hypothetical protein WL99_32755 [Burkholderia cepacia]|uniref:hypothetical protein n=1 Tax=Burkholderia cepacia TaxID=292 RepID=UPI00075EFFA6|nr:hypothetical protein [Burkholderia cepacia]KWH38508.1 hypothetical protein WL99_32755 [Burkholderia cepacia]
MDQQEILTTLVEQLDQQNMQMTVLRSAYLVLARQLEIRGLLPLTDLKADLRTMAAAQPDEDWQFGHEELAAALQHVHAVQGSHRQSARRHRLKGL